MAELRYVDWDGLVYYDGKIKAYIADGAEDYLKMGGIVTFENLPEPSFQNLNYIYKISDKFVSDSDFYDVGKEYTEGTWVQVTDINNEGVFLYTIFNDSVIGGIDPEDYYTKTEVDSLLDTVVTVENVTTIVEEEIETKVVTTIEQQVQQVVQEKVDNNELDVNVSSITYGDF